MNKPIEQLIANLLTWAAVFGTTLLFKGASGAKDATETISKFFDGSQIGYIVIGCLGIFTLFSLIATKSRNANEQANARHFSVLALDELGSNLYTFGSVCILLGLATLQPAYFIGTIAFWAAGLWLKW